MVAKALACGGILGNLFSLCEKHGRRLSLKSLEYRRNLPHFQPEGAMLFITFRLYGTLPLASGRDGRTFALADRELEQTQRGPSWLKQPRVAECVVETIKLGDVARGLYELVAFVVMPNHVHLLINPKVPAPKITQYVKGVSAKRANEILGKTGKPFWQDESYDRWVRSSEERRKIVRYIELNPVRAKLADEAQLFRYSSAFAE
jgi:putative transposase